MRCSGLCKKLKNLFSDGIYTYHKSITISNNSYEEEFSETIFGISISSRLSCIKVHVLIFMASTTEVVDHESFQLCRLKECCDYFDFPRKGTRPVCSFFVHKIASSKYGLYDHMMEKRIPKTERRTLRKVLTKISMFRICATIFVDEL